MPAVASSSATRQIQTPTCIQTRVRSTADAHKLFLAVQRGLLPLVRRRLDAEERLSLAPGNVYIWEERPASADGPGPAMERFTEGKRWSQSRVREEFFFYHEKYQPPQDVQLTPTGDVRPPPDWQPLVKQTYSVITTTEPRQKLHLTTYYVQATVDSLGTTDDIPELAGIVVPPGLYIATREENRRQKRADTSARKRPTVSTKSTAGGVQRTAERERRGSTASSASPTSTMAPPLPVPLAQPRTYAPYPGASYPNGHGHGHHRLSRDMTGAMAPPAQIPMSPHAMSPTSWTHADPAPGPGPGPGPSFRPQNPAEYTQQQQQQGAMYPLPTLSPHSALPQLSTNLSNMNYAIPNSPMAPSPTSWSGQPLPAIITAHEHTYVQHQNLRRGSLAPTEASTSTGSGSNGSGGSGGSSESTTMEEGYRAFSPSSTIPPISMPHGAENGEYNLTYAPTPQQAQNLGLNMHGLNMMEYGGHTAQNQQSPIDFGFPTTPLPALNPAAAAAVRAQTRASEASQSSPPPATDISVDPTFWPGVGGGQHAGAIGMGIGANGIGGWETPGLAPLEVLESPSPYRRDPGDENYLLRLSLAQKGYAWS